MANLLKGKNIVVMGVANQRSIAWGIARSLHREGANLIFTNRQERSAKKLEKLLKDNETDESILISCDVAEDESIKKLVSFMDLFTPLRLLIVMNYKETMQTHLEMDFY